MKLPLPKKPKLILQKVKDNKYYVKVPGLKIPVILSEFLYKKWMNSKIS